ncbi:sugar phosphate nucleotidyltransferase [Aquisediminimonas sediminicola]|uniref:sugar phosphate nucleotidyltransferase n=1 Tax=Alteraquisediminimonas sediminicola TaxID=2676787 RepID=UPI001C8EC72B|nr:sugar phosphate nucleotidyltransferase [Aquisediminimonas sediminicola]
MSIVHPVILCGGSGARLWPMSRKSYPKQFCALIDDDSLYQATIKRVSGDGFAPPIIVTAAPFRFIAADQLACLRIAASQILIEPEGRNTAPAVLAAAYWLARDDEDALMLVTPADHVLMDQGTWQQAIEEAQPLALAGDLVLISPQDAKIGNGLLLAKVSTLLHAFQTHAPNLIEIVGAAVANAQHDLDFHRLASAFWTDLPYLTVEDAILAKANNIRRITVADAWVDADYWTDIPALGDADPAGNICTERTDAIDCTGSLLRSEAQGQHLIGIGLEDIIAVAMPDAVLVAHRSRSADVGRAVERLMAQHVPQATLYPREHRPWGWYESIAIGERFQVKRIMVKPGGSISLQSHTHRAEHWIIVAGTARVSIDDEVRLVTENQSVYVPLGAVHRLENPGKLPVMLIEVQTGAYLGEDDIIRYADIYARG